MATPTYWIKINSTTLTKVRKYAVQRNKLWTDAGRNMAGDLRATFVGIFPKINVEFTYMTGDEMKALMLLIDLPSFTLSWWDEVTQTYKSGSYYAGDFEMSYFDKTKALYEPLKINFIPYSKI